MPNIDLEAQALQEVVSNPNYLLSGGTLLLQAVGFPEGT